MIKLEEVKARHGRATPGPYTLEDSISDYHDKNICAKGPIVSGVIAQLFTKWPNEAHAEQECNADFLAASWQDVKDLIEEVERLRGIEAAAQRVCDAKDWRPLMDAHHALVNLRDALASREGGVKR